MKTIGRMMGFLKETRPDVLTLEANNYEKIVWYLDAALGVHNDCKSHTGAVMTLGNRTFQSINQCNKKLIPEVQPKWNHI
jgi:hypothetical protein